mmetsp:Transcript_26365/g.41962  ORF Transcript_26365/g.41962 Transcript_26365/m.41962 type:complete len:237 (+) Transcript_26365:663-1373(+)
MTVATQSTIMRIQDIRKSSTSSVAGTPRADVLAFSLATTPLNFAFAFSNSASSSEICFCTPSTVARSVSLLPSTASMAALSTASASSAFDNEDLKPATFWLSPCTLAVACSAASLCADASSVAARTSAFSSSICLVPLTTSAEAFASATLASDASWRACFSAAAFCVARFSAASFSATALSAIALSSESSLKASWFPLDASFMASCFSAFACTTAFSAASFAASAFWRSALSSDAT